MTPYVPLRLHSEFSVEDGIVRLPEAVAFAREQGFPALALTDAMNMFGMVKFYTMCRAAGMVPIFGADVEMQPSVAGGSTSRLLLLAKNHDGYLRLCEWLSAAYLAEERGERACVDWARLEEDDTSGLICLSAAAEGVVGQAILGGRMDEAAQWASKLAGLFPDAFYLELQRLPEHVGDFSDALHQQFHALRHQAETVLAGSLQLAAQLDLPPVATHAVQFMHGDDFIAHEARVCIAAGAVLSDRRRERKFHPSQYFLPYEAMAELFADLPEALANSVEIARRCSTEIELGKNYLPDFPTPNNLSLDDFLRQESRAGLTRRMEVLFPDASERAAKLPEYQARLEFELDTIIQMGFPGYFLIVADFINWAKNNGCPVGPGRGSGAGSLVAYSLKITDLDPIRYALLFERFLNPERVSMPDFDVDFCQENRGRVIDYVRQKYGMAAVSQIITFGTLSSKAVVRDVGRVLDLPFGLCDRLSKLIPLEANKPLSLAKAMEVEPEIGRIIREEEAEELMVLAQKLEDLTRGTGMHAGGVLIAPGKLTDFCPVYRAAGDDAASVSMYDKDDVEAVGLVKFDFLGLRNLTIIEMAQEMIRTHRGETVDVAHIPLDDAAVYRDIFAKANTTAVFQFESAGMKRMLQDARPTKFEEIIAFVALYRPGPMDLIPDFIRRMHGKEKFEYLHPLLVDILQPTYGIMVYQEQVMQAAQLCAGYSLGGADMLRRAMGKKKPEEMAKQRETFVAGAAQKDISAEKANEIFDYMEKFAGYGFNKSHAAAYALVAYQTAWLKKHYLAEFVAATMSSELDNTDQLKIFYDDAVANGITFLPPSVNHSDYRFTPHDEYAVRYALGAIKGTGESAVAAIVAARRDGAFQDLFDFCSRVDKQAVNRRALEALIRAGAFDEIDDNRAMLLENVTLAMDYAEQQEANRHQCGLFDFDQSAIEAVQLKPTAPWSLAQRLAEEKLAMGFYFSAHPFAPYEAEVRPLARLSLDQIKPQDYRQWLGGFVTQVRTVMTKTGRKMWIALLEDLSAKLEITVRDEAIEAFGGTLSADQLLLFECKVSKDDYNGGEGLRISAEKILSLDAAREQHARSLQLTLNPAHDINAVAEVLQRYRSGERLIPLVIHYRSSEVSGSLKAEKTWNIVPQQALLDELHILLGHENVGLRW
ncbi:MAG: DNA polymerase III subunit alpha [Neisseria sp.]|nr:DNA polymerase III subunit alpha [Neisseria sp.]